MAAGAAVPKIRGSDGEDRLGGACAARGFEKAAEGAGIPAEGAARPGLYPAAQYFPGFPPPREFGKPDGRRKVPGAGGLFLRSARTRHEKEGTALSGLIEKFRNA